MKTVRIGQKIIGENHPVFLVAEAGFNHNGSVELALELIDAAAASGADAIKFQSFTPEKLLHSSVTYRNLFDSARLDRAAHERLFERAGERGILFASTPFDEEWVRALDEVGTAFIKIASMDLTTPSLLRAAAKTGRPVVLSTGLADLDEVRGALKILGSSDVVLLHCVSLYPTPLVDLNLRAIRTMAAEFDRPVGFSDHTLGLEAPVWAVAAGACMIEKHFTTDRNLPGADHAHSLDPDGFRALVKAVNEIEIGMGSGEKRPGAEEAALRDKTRRGLAASRAIRKGETIRAADLIPLRPIPEPDGIPAAEVHSVDGRIAVRDILEGSLLRRSDIAV